MFRQMAEIAGASMRVASQMVPFSSADTSRTFHVNESPEEAQQIANAIEVSDAGNIPPGVSAWRSGESSFEAVAPMGSVRANITVASDGNGGSYVTEQTRTRSPIPFMAHVADAVHSVATDPERGYNAARARHRS